MKIYKCECGKEFCNSQKINAHKSHCKVHYLIKYNSDELYYRNINIRKEASKKAKLISNQNFLIKKEKEIQKWIEEHHICEKCGKIMTEKFGSGRFCSRQCANSRNFTEEQKAKISKSMINHQKEKFNDQHANHILFCIKCNSPISKNNKSKLCKKCYRQNQIEKNIGLQIQKSNDLQSNYLWENYPAFDCDENGKIYKNGIEIKPFKSKKYLQVCLFDKNNNKKVAGVHSVVAMKYLNYYEGCVVHHKDENTLNNSLSNLEVINRSEHTRYHAKKSNFYKSMKGKTPWNKGKIMSEEYCKKMSEAAKKRYSRNKI